MSGLYTSGRGLLVILFLLIPQISQAITVKTVPWVATNPLIPHDSWSGKSVTLKGTTDVQGSNIQYSWDFGDGSPVVNGTVTDRYNIGVKHSYTGLPGDVFTARLSVEDISTGETASNTYFIQIRERNLETEVNVAIDEGLWYLHKFQTRTTSSGVDYGDWRSRSGCNACSTYYGITAANVNAFEVNGHLESGSVSNPYTETVARGMRSIFNYLRTESIGNRTYPAPTGTVNPDSNGNNYGVRINQGQYVYQGGMFMDVIIASGTPDAITVTGAVGSGVNPGIRGRRYADIVQDMADSYAYGQYNANSSARGGWRYVWNQAPDNSANQWAAIGLIPAERNWGLTVPEWVKTENEVWLNYSQNSAGRFGYSRRSYFPWNDFGTTPSGMVQLVMDGIGRGDTRWDNSETYIRNSFGRTGGAGNAIKDYYYGLLAFVKSMRLHEPAIDLLGGDYDWYNAEVSQGAFTDGVARTLVNDQNGNGYWRNHNYHSEQYPFETAWAILMLGQTLFESGSPVAVAQALPNPGVAGQVIKLDGGGSFHQDASKQIDSWEWDFDNDGSYDAVGAQVGTTFPAVGDYPVTLRVTDDGDPEKSDTTVVTIRITVPPVAPTANAGGPYLFCPGVPMFLDGTTSNNPDEGQSEIGQPGDTIQAYAWDLDGDGDFNETLVAQPDVTDYFTALGVGDYLVRLRVTDSTSTAYPSSGLGDLSDTDSTQVSVKDASDTACSCLNDLYARSKSGKVQLVWTDSGAHHYNIYRGTTAGGPYNLIASTDSRYSTYLDYTVSNENQYFYMVRTAAANGDETCQSIEVSASPTASRRARNEAPVIVSTPLSSAVEGFLYSYDVEAIDAENATITYSLDTAPSGMSIDAVTGLISWTPLNAQVGVHTIVVRVTDPRGASGTQVFTVTVANANRPPQITSSPVTGVTEGQLYAYDADAIDLDTGDSLNFSLTAAPAGMVIDGASGVINWTPTNAQTGNHDVTVTVTDSGGLSDSQSYLLQVFEANLPPAITSTPSVDATEGVLYNYDVDASDPNTGDVLTFSLLTPPAGMTVDAASGLINWTPDATQTGDNTIVVEVTDAGGLSVLQTFTVRVAFVNDPPVIISTPETTATEGVAYQYDVNATDPDLLAGDILTFSLDVAPAGMNINASSGLVQWQPGETQVGTQQVTVRVRDAQGAFDIQSYNIGVANQDDAPSIVSTPVTNATEGSLYSYDVDATDPDIGDTLGYSLTVAPSAMSIDPASGLIQWTPDNAQVGDQAVSVQVTDTSGLIATQSFVITVSNINQAPSIDSSANVNATEGQLYQYDVNATDPDAGDTVSFGLDLAPTGMTIDSVSGLIQWIPTEAQTGDQNVTVRVTDAAGLFDSQSFTVSVANEPDVPVITSSPVVNASENVAYSYDVEASDPDVGDTLSYSLDSAPAGMIIDTSSGLIQWTPGEADIGNHAVTVRVTDAGGLFATQSYTLNVADIQHTPQITSTPETTATINIAYSYDVDASDADTGDILSYSLDSAPAGMSIDSVSGLINWTPIAAQLGSHDVMVQVSDGNGGIASQNYTVAVSDVPNNAPVITSTPVFSGTQDAVYSYDVDASDADGDTLSYSLTIAPVGMTIDAVSGLITWTPSAAQLGSQVVTVQVSDGKGGVASQNYTVVVIDVPNNAPVINSTPVFSATQDVAYSYDVDASDADGDTLAYSLSIAPVGMTIDAVSGLITWTPSAAQLGSQVVTVQVSDGKGGVASQNFSVSVTAIPTNQAPSIISTPNTAATANTGYSYAVAANDPDGDVLDYSLTVAPAGMTIDNLSGLISWTPTEAQVGSRAVTVRVDDGQAFAEQSYSIIVTDDSLPLDVFISLSPQVLDLGSTTTVTVSSAGGVAPVTLTLTQDGIPVALDGAGQATLNGDAVGSYQLVAMAVDVRETVDAQSYFSVRDPADTTPPSVGITGPVGDTEISAPVQIIGTADDANLAQYRLLVSPAGQNQFVEISSSSTPVTNGVLGTFDPTQFDNGLYDLAVIVTDVNGQQSSTVVTYRVTGDMKVGNFSFSVQDLSIPLAGIPITINRTYDSRKKFRKMDFGYGWSIDYQDVKVEENIELGRNWTQTASGGFFPTYCVDPVGAHVVTVTLPDGKVEEFDMGVSPRCNLLIPLQFVDPVFTARPGTTSTLVAQNVGQLWYSGGTLLDPGLFNTYDPDQYTLTTAEGYVYVLDQNFGILTVTDPNGNTLTYSSSGIIHSSGKSVSFTRDGQGRITGITDPVGNIINYAYNVNGDLESVTDQVGDVTRHRYNRSHGLTEFIDPRGITPARNIYNDEGRLIATEDADGNRIELNHDVSGRQEVVRDRLGNVTIFGYDDNGYTTSETDALGNTSAFTRDANGNELSKTDPLGNTTSKTFDTNDNPLSEIDPLGNTISRSFNSKNDPLTITDKNGNVISNTYDANGNLTRVTDPLGNSRNNSFNVNGNLSSIIDEGGHTTSFTYDSSGNKASETDPLGNVVTFQYDANGNSTGNSRTRSDGSLTVTVTTKKIYDAANRMIAEVDGEGFSVETEYNSLGKEAIQIGKNGNSTEFEYDSRGNLVLTRYPDGTQSSIAYDVEGNKISETDQAGNTTSFEYDALKRLIRTTYADGALESNSYDAAGRLITATDARGNITSYEYDALGQRTGVTDPLGNQTIYTYDANGNQTSIIDANGNTTLYEYDVLNRRIRHTFPDGTQINYTYDALGRKISETDQAGVTTQFNYDAMGRLIRVTDALGGQTDYTYDELGNKLMQTDAEGRTTSWTYDNVGNIRSRTLPLGQTETFSYDGNGNKLTHTDFNGDTLTFNYDNLDRLVLKTYPDTTTVAYTYTPTGKVQTVTDDSGVTSHSYDSRDRLIRVDNPDGSFILYSYDANGNRTGLTTPLGNTTYTFDALNRLETVTDVNSGVTAYGYDVVGNRASVSYPNGTEARYTYDALNRLTNLQNLRSDNSVINNYIYTLGATGNRIRIVENFGRTVDYTYDALYRLVSESVTDLINGNFQLDYTYDGVGNRLSRTADSIVTINYNYDDNDRLLTEGTTTYSYDNNGNTLSKNDGSLTAYSYDVENRLQQVQTGTRTLEYSYDADGIRRSVSENGVVTNHLVDKNRDYAQVLEERDAANNLQVFYTYGDDLISQERGSSVSYYHYDGLGSTRALSDNSETATDSYTYEAFGNLLLSTGTTLNTYLFSGEQFDPNTGFYYLRARYMNPEHGRFLTTDPFMGLMHEPVTLHKYLYAGLDPVDNTDPSGEFFGGFGGFGLSLSIGIRLYASSALFYAAPAIYLVQRVLLRVNVAFLTRFVNLATARFYQSAQTTLINSRRILRLDAGRAFETLVNPAMRLIGAVRHRPIPGAIPDWIFRGRHIIDAKLGQSVNIGQLRHFVNWASLNGGNVVYITLTRTPPGVVQSARNIGNAKGVVVNFISLTPF